MTGVVVDALSRPVAGASVALTAGPVELPDIAALTNNDGSFSFGVPQAGAYRVEAYGGSGHVSASVEVQPGKGGPVRLVLPSE